MFGRGRVERRTQPAPAIGAPDVAVPAEREQGLPCAVTAVIGGNAGRADVDPRSGSRGRGGGDEEGGNPEAASHAESVHRMATFRVMTDYDRGRRPAGSAATVAHAR